MESATATLPKRQQEVLEAHGRGLNPTQIGRELGITPQAVHGHLRKLKDRGLIEADEHEAAAPVQGAAKSPAQFYEEALADLQHQIANVEARRREIAAQIEDLQAQDTEWERTHERLTALLPA